MKIIQNKWINKFIPFPNFRAINLFGVLFARGAKPLTNVTLNHESIHSAQIVEVIALAALSSFPLVFFGLWWVFLLIAVSSYYVLYCLEYLARLVQYRDRRLAYRNISFEREAYSNERKQSYLKHRRVLEFIRYL